MNYSQINNLVHEGKIEEALTMARNGINVDVKAVVCTPEFVKWALTPEAYILYQAATKKIQGRK